MKWPLASIFLIAAVLLGARIGAADAATPSKSLKGWELYSWREGTEWRFSLLVGTNAAKSCAMIKNDKATKTLAQLEAALAALAPLDEVYWEPPQAANLRDACDIAYP